MRKELGAIWLDDQRCKFRVWAPRSARIHLHMVAPNDSVSCMEPKQLGYHTAVLEGIKPGTRYFYRLSNGKEFPDPASRFQPDGVHGPSEVVDARFKWTDEDWFGPPIDNYILYELHVGTFTSDGTFDAIIPRLNEL